MLKEIKTSTGLIIIFALAVVLFGGVYTYYNVCLPDIQTYSSANNLIVPHTKTTTTAATSTTGATATTPATTATTTTPAATALADWQTYTNSTYGFTLTFTKDWQGYKVKQANVEGEVATFYFELPSTDPLYAEATTTADAGYATVFVIGVMNKSEWTGAEEQMRDFGSKITENTKYVFTSSTAQAMPTDAIFETTRSQISDIVDSFTLI